MKRLIFKLSLFSFLSATALVGCSDLEIEGTDSIIDRETATEGVFNGVEDVEGALNNAFNGLNRVNDQANIYALQEITTDELLVPTRGTDWGDNGIWRTLHQHTWDATHPFILSSWNGWNSSIFLTSEIIDPRSNANELQVAQASFARAYSTWIVMDNFGQVPFRAPDEGPSVDPTVMQRPEALQFILDDLDVAIAGLPEVPAGNMDQLTRGTKASARFLRAKILLNAHIYRGEATANSSDMAEVISLVDQIAADGFALEEGYFEIFEPSADRETIWWRPAAVGNRIWSGLHYNQPAPDNGGGGWNGFTTLAEFYDLFEGDPNHNYIGAGQEERRGWVPDENTANEENFGIGWGFLINQQYGANGQPLEARGGKPLSFTRELPGLVGNSDVTGIRTIKYHPKNGSFQPHLIMFRYSDAHLMKAEAMWRSGGDPTALVNELRTLRDATPLASVTESDLIDERGREFYKEMWRRNDLIRFGQFTKDWKFKNDASVGDETKNLFPIPSNALLSNPNLTQNPGY